MYNMRFLLGLFTLAAFMGTVAAAPSRTNAELMHALVTGGRRQYQDIMLYNDLHGMVAAGDPAHKAMSSGLDGLMDVYDRLYSYGFSLAGYQFIGLAVSSINASISWPDQLAFFLLSCGFVMSCFSALLSFCMYEYICGIRNESNEFIVAGMNAYRPWLFLPHPLLLFNTSLFIIPFNILIHSMLLPYFAISMNLISCALCGGFYIHRRMIVDKQEYVPVSRVSEVLGDPVEETLIENDTPSTTLLKRNINSTVSASNVSEL
jgi:hypothetical protein